MRGWKLLYGTTLMAVADTWYGAATGAGLNQA